MVDIMSRVLIVGISFSIALSVCLLLLGVDTPDSTIIGLVSIAISLLLELISRLAKAQEKLIAASGLSRSLLRDETLFSAISTIVEDYHSVIRRRDGYSMFANRARELLSECSDGIHDLVEGYMILPPLSQFSFGLKGFSDVRHTIKSTSYVDAEGFWKSVAGEKYLQANIELVRRGVKITRIFIGNRRNVGRAKEVMTGQREAGIRVLIALIEEIPRDLCEDFLVADDSILAQLQLTREGIPRSERISIDPQEVRRAINGFDRLVAGAYEYDTLFPGGTAIPQVK